MQLIYVELELRQILPAELIKLSDFNSMNYNLFKSRTFWSLVVMFVVNGYAAISGQVPSGIDMVINFALTSLATYFHINKSAQTPTV